MYSIASIQASGWGGCYLVAGRAAMAIVVLSFDAVAAALLLKRRLARSSKVSEGAV